MKHLYIISLIFCVLSVQCQNDYKSLISRFELLELPVHLVSENYETYGLFDNKPTISKTDLQLLQEELELHESCNYGYLLMTSWISMH